MPGAKITMTTTSGEDVASAISDASGSFLIRGLKPGDYKIRATFSGFVPFQSGVITLAANQVKRIDIVMAIEVAQQSVSVSDGVAEVNVEAGGNTSAVVHLPTTRTSWQANYRHWPGRLPAPTAERSLLTGSAEANFPRSRRSCRFG